MSVLLSSNTIRAVLKRAQLKPSHGCVRLLAIESKTPVTKPKSLDDVYTKIISKQGYTSANNDMFFASTAYDQVLTRVTLRSYRPGRCLRLVWKVVTTKEQILFFKTSQHTNLIQKHTFLMQFANFSKLGK